MGRAGLAGPACGGKRFWMIGQGLLAEAGEDAEGMVEQRHQRRGEDATEERGRDGEFGDEPESVWRQARGEAMAEVGDLRRGEAIEKEVGDDEVVVRSFFGGHWGPEAQVGDLRGKPAGVGGCALFEQLHHAWAGVDGCDANGGVGAKQRRGEAAIAVSEDQCVAALGEPRQEVRAAALKKRAEREVFEPAVDAGKRVEVGSGGHARAIRKMGAGRAG